MFEQVGSINGEVSNLNFTFDSYFIAKYGVKSVQH